MLIDFPSINIHMILISPKPLMYFPSPFHMCSSVLGVSSWFPVVDDPKVIPDCLVNW